jgi:hypothetical protein
MSASACRRRSVLILGFSAFRTPLGTPTPPSPRKKVGPAASFDVTTMKSIYSKPHPVTIR